MKLIQKKEEKRGERGKKRREEKERIATIIHTHIALNN